MIREFYGVSNGVSGFLNQHLYSDIQMPDHVTSLEHWATQYMERNLGLVVTLPLRECYSAKCYLAKLKCEDEIKQLKEEIENLKSKVRELESA